MFYLEERRRKIICWSIFVSEFYSHLNDNMGGVGGDDIAKGIELFEGLDCFSCHETKGYGKDRNSVIGPDLKKRDGCLYIQKLKKYQLN